jgi:hypothetical protein
MGKMVGAGVGAGAGARAGAGAGAGAGIKSTDSATMVLTQLIFSYLLGKMVSAVLYYKFMIQYKIINFCSDNSRKVGSTKYIIGLMQVP